MPSRAPQAEAAAKAEAEAAAKAEAAAAAKAAEAEAEEAGDVVPMSRQITDMYDMYTTILEIFVDNEQAFLVMHALNRLLCNNNDTFKSDNNTHNTHSTTHKINNNSKRNSRITNSNGNNDYLSKKKHDISGNDATK